MVFTDLSECVACPNSLILYDFIVWPLNSVVGHDFVYICMLCLVASASKFILITGYFLIRVNLIVVIVVCLQTNTRTSGVRLTI